MPNTSIAVVPPEKPLIAIAQILCLDGDRSVNFVRIENAVREAKEKNARLVVLPGVSYPGLGKPGGAHPCFSHSG